MHSTGSHAAVCCVVPNGRMMDEWHGKIWKEMVMAQSRYYFCTE
jgi:hypothetical protein